MMKRREFLAAAAAVPAAVSTIRAATVPRPALWKAFPTLGGKQIDLAAYKGKVLAVEFLLTHCPACQRCARAVENVYRGLGASGFQAVGLAVNPMANTLVPDFIQKQGITFPIGWCAEPEYREYLEMSVMTAPRFPQLVIVDKKGMVRGQFAGSDPFLAGADEEKNVRALVTTLLAEGGPVKGAPAAAKKKG
jgi:peroxiredoxin